MYAPCTHHVRTMKHYDLSRTHACMHQLCIDYAYIHVNIYLPIRNADLMHATSTSTSRLRFRSRARSTPQPVLSLTSTSIPATACIYARTSPLAASSTQRLQYIVNTSSNSVRIPTYTNLSPHPQRTVANQSINRLIATCMHAC